MFVFLKDNQVIYCAVLPLEIRLEIALPYCENQKLLHLYHWYSPVVCKGCSVWVSIFGSDFSVFDQTDVRGVGNLCF